MGAGLARPAEEYYEGSDPGRLMLPANDERRTVGTIPSYEQ